MCLMSLIETIFKRGSGSRSLSFQEIAQGTHLPINEVEHLIMKGLSLKLVKGALDEVEQTFNVSWVQPRVLEMVQIKQVMDGVQAWRHKVHGTTLLVEKGTPELVGQ